MKHYTDIIPLELAEKLKDKGMLIANVVDSITGEKSCRYTYAHIFDWLMEKDMYIRIEPFVATAFVAKSWGWSYRIDRLREPSFDTKLGFGDWHEAATKAIEKALTLI